MEIGLEVSGIDDAIARLNAAVDRVKDLGAALAEIAAELRRFIDERFSTRTSPDGKAWAALKARSVSRDVMRRSVFARPIARGVEYGASAPWAEYQNESRPFMPDGHTTGPAAELIRRIEAILRRHIVPDEQQGE